VTDVETRYRRIVLKVSGESLGSHTALDIDRVTEAAQAIAAVRGLGVTVTVIVGGGNIFRGAQAATWEMERPLADAVGMAATGVNALLLDGVLARLGVPAHIFSRGPCTGIGTPYNREEFRATLNDGQVALLAGGMGVSGFSTDVPAVHAAIDMTAEVILMAKHGVDGVYTADPKHVPDARFMARLSATEALERKLRVMDASALTLARDHGKCIHVVSADDPNSVRLAVEGKEIGSVIDPS
jgi:uridylate kinase